MLDNLPRGTICIEDIEMGMSRHLHKVISDEDIALFAQVSTDHNPVHLDERYARDTIFQGRIAHGMLTAGLISAVIGTIRLMITHHPRITCTRLNSACLCRCKRRLATSVEARKSAC